MKATRMKLMAAHFETARRYVRKLAQYRAELTAEERRVIDEDVRLFGVFAAELREEAERLPAEPTQDLSGGST